MVIHYLIYIHIWATIYIHILYKYTYIHGFCTTLFSYHKCIYTSIRWNIQHHFLFIILTSSKKNPCNTVNDSLEFCANTHSSTTYIQTHTIRWEFPGIPKQPKRHFRRNHLPSAGVCQFKLFCEIIALEIDCGCFYLQTYVHYTYIQVCTAPYIIQK